MIGFCLLVGLPVVVGIAMLLQALIKDILEERKHKPTPEIGPAGPGREGTLLLTSRRIYTGKK